MFEWVLAKKIMESMGMTDTQVKKNRELGHWEYGVHYQKFGDGRYWYNVPAIIEWQVQNAKKGLEKRKNPRAA